MKTLRTITLLAVLLSLLLSACAPAAPAPAASEPAATEPAAEAPAPADAAAPAAVAAGEPMALTCAEPIKVGLITDASGALAIYGAHILRSFMLGMEYAAGAPGSAGEKFDFTQTQNNTFTFGDCTVEVLVRDDKSTPDTTAAVARELIDVDQVDVIVGTVSSGATATLQGIAAESQIPLIVAPAAANDITGASFNEYTFRTSRSNYQDAMNLCEYLPTQYTSLVQIAPDYNFGWGSAAAFRDSCTLNGGEFVADDILAPADTTDFTPYMEQILDSGAEAYIVTWAGGGFIPMMQAATDTGVTEEMALGATFVDNVALPAFFANAIGTTSGILYNWALPQNPINDWMVAETRARYGLAPDLFDADGFNAALMLVHGLQATGGDASAAGADPGFRGHELRRAEGHDRDPARRPRRDPGHVHRQVGQRHRPGRPLPGAGDHHAAAAALPAARGAEGSLRRPALRQPERPVTKMERR
jgi:branched-chain amino acid transport system substrate-binding protein